MNSFLSMPSVCLQEMLSDFLATAEQLHTASIEFTVLRENKQPIGFEVNIRYLLAEQKETSSHYPDPKHVKKTLAPAKRMAKQLRQTVS